MANFQYIAKTADGQEVTGVMQGDSEAAVVRSLDDRKLYPIHVSEQAPPREKIGGRVKPRDVGVMYGQLADLLKAGVPLLRSLDVLVRTSTKGSMAEIVRKVHDDVAGGKTLAEAMSMHPKAFTNLHGAMVRAGERAGFLEDVLTNLAQFIERQDELRSKVRGAMIYPILLTVIGTVILTGVLVILVPKFKPLFENAPGVSLPAPTIFLFALSDLMKNQLPLFIAIIVLIVVAVRMFIRSDYGRKLWDAWQLKIPILGHALRMVSITRFCRILGTMLTNGVPILQALGIAKDAAGSLALAESIAKATDNVRAGDPLAEPLRASGMFPPEIVEMIAVAEESNQLDKVLVQIADTVERRTNRQVDQSVRLIEPIILVIMAAAIGFVAIGLLYPIFTLSQTIGK